MMNDSGLTTAQAIASAIVAVAFLGLVGLIFWRATTPGADFGTIWGSTSTIVGVVIGAIPSFFFRSQAKAERARSAQLGDRNTALAAAASVEQVAAVINGVSGAFPASVRRATTRSPRPQPQPPSRNGADPGEPAAHQPDPEGVGIESSEV